MRNYKIISRFIVLHEAWESDSDGLFVEYEDGSKGIVLTSHGREYEAEPVELEDKIREYINLINEYAEVLKQLGLDCIFTQEVIESHTPKG